MLSSRGFIVIAHLREGRQNERKRGGCRGGGQRVRPPSAISPREGRVPRRGGRGGEHSAWFHSQPSSERCFSSQHIGRVSGGCREGI